MTEKGTIDKVVLHSITAFDRMRASADSTATFLTHLQDYREENNRRGEFGKEQMSLMHRVGYRLGSEADALLQAVSTLRHPPQGYVSSEGPYLRLVHGE